MLGREAGRLGARGGIPEAAGREGAAAWAFGTLGREEGLTARTCPEAAPRLPASPVAAHHGGAKHLGGHRPAVSEQGCP